MEVPNNDCQNHPRLHGMQAAQLQQAEEQEEQSRSSRDEEVLPLLQKAHGPSRNQVSEGALNNG
jgi:hypothetical protein